MTTAPEVVTKLFIILPDLGLALRIIVPFVLYYYKKWKGVTPSWGVITALEGVPPFQKGTTLGIGAVFGVFAITSIIATITSRTFTLVTITGIIPYVILGSLILTKLDLKFIFGEKWKWFIGVVMAVGILFRLVRPAAVAGETEECNCSCST